MRTRDEGGASGPLDRDVLVTGADGVIGRVLRARFAGQGITFTDRDTLDVSSRFGLAGHLLGYKTVVHLATTLRAPIVDAARAVASLRLARNVVQASLEARVTRVVLMSSIRAADLPLEWRGREAELAWTPMVGRTGRAIERLGQRAARSGLDIIAIRCGAMIWPDRPLSGLQGGVWLSHEDCRDIFRLCFDEPMMPGRFIRFTAVSDTRLRRHDTSNPIGWVSGTRAFGIRRYLHYRKVQIKSALKTGIDRWLTWSR